MVNISRVQGYDLANPTRRMRAFTDTAGVLSKHVLHKFFREQWVHIAHAYLAADKKAKWILWLEDDTSPQHKEVSEGQLIKR